jgi:phage/plasmid primase-like uncharacterized protein
VTSLLGRFARLRKGARCPICGKPDWCMVAYDGSGAPLSVLCQRVKSTRRWRDAGCLHVLAPGGGANQWDRAQRPAETTVTPLRLVRRLEAAQRRFHSSAATPAIASRLGVSVRALGALGTGIEGDTLLFPMLDGDGELIGVRTRSSSGEKRAVTGSKNGLFAAVAIDSPARLYICEGPTDTAAALTIGLAAVGRPSCLGGGDHIERLLDQTWPREAVVVADADGPGREGALDLARRLAARPTLLVRVIEPSADAKDLRAWVQAGARARDVERVADSAPVLVVPRRLRREA